MWFCAVRAFFMAVAMFFFYDMYKKRQTSHLTCLPLCVGVDGFEPPTLCL